MKLAGRHFRLLPQNGFHQGVVDEDVLLLDQPNGDKRHKGCLAAGMADHCTDGLTDTHIQMYNFVFDMPKPSLCIATAILQ